jgi:hypothetical protein
MIEPFRAAFAEQMREAIRVRLQFAVNNRFAGFSYDESRLQWAQIGMLAGIRRFIIPCDCPVDHTDRYNGCLIAQACHTATFLDQSCTSCCCQ